MSNVALRSVNPPSDPSAAAWSGPRDPMVYASVELRAERLLSWIDLKRRETGERITVTHAVVRALAVALNKHAQANAVVRWGRAQPREQVDIFAEVPVQRGERSEGVELAGVCIRSADTRPVAEIASELLRGTQRGKVQASGGRLPAMVAGPLLKILRFLQVELNLSTRLLGAEGDPYGSAMVTSLGMMGVRVAYAPLHPMASSAVALMVGAVEQRPVVEDGEVVPGRVLTLNLSCDHRVVDSANAALLGRELKRLLEHPRLLELDGEREHMLMGAQLATSELETLDVDSDSMTMEAETEATNTGYDETPMEVF